ncbi:hypothetical protein Spica_0518 [Gracilinema caldarium DSM 7334]|uniref:Uncharacterized protein n=1 Tax=Gracilinema caldarium (strain ATCC 51460 / DSM 7334 / H1) TaxID=744872 RepID=F8F027_GRAC1|nr:hypothetical protein Spica_0518 [Gracilinema caldarium DSM 7334]
MKRLNSNDSLILLFAVSLFGIILLWGMMLFGKSPYWAFVSLFFIVVLINPPRRAVSLLTVYYAYYGIWFVFASMCGNRLVQALTNPLYFVSILYVFITFCTGMLAITLADSISSTRTKSKLVRPSYSLKKQTIVLLYILSTCSIIAIVLASGGFSRWVANPGDAFLNRAGSGLYVILSHFFTMLLAGGRAVTAPGRRGKTCR